MTGSVIYSDIPSCDPKLIEKLRTLSVADLSDAISAKAGGQRILNERIRSVIPGERLCGQAVTAFCEPGDGLMSHCALYLAKAGNVLILSNLGSADGAIWGGNMAIDAKSIGLAGIVCDGAIRDTALIRELKVPTWASATSFKKPAKAGRGSVNVPVECGGVLVAPGDIVVADDDGILVLSPSEAEAIIAIAQDRIEEERVLRLRISRGERLFEAAGLRQMLDDYGFRIRQGCWSDEN